MQQSENGSYFKRRLKIGRDNLVFVSKNYEVILEKLTAAVTTSLRKYSVIDERSPRELSHVLDTHAIPIVPP